VDDLPGVVLEAIRLLQGFAVTSDDPALWGIDRLVHLYTLEEDTGAPRLL
jgi:hypothetical protein